MKKLSLIAILGFIATQSTITDTNQINGPNNVVISGENNKLNGKDNKVTGYDNQINGIKNEAKGKKNLLDGNNNFVEGNNNQVKGKDNFVIGQGNLILGPESSQQEIQKANKKLAQMFAARGLGNLFGINTPPRQPQVQPQQQPQTQIKTQNNGQITKVSPVIKQPQQKKQVQLRPESKAQSIVEPKPLIQTDVKKDAEIEKKPKQQQIDQQSKEVKKEEQQINVQTKTLESLIAANQNVDKKQEIKKIIPEQQKDLQKLQKDQNQHKTEKQADIVDETKKKSADDVLFDLAQNSHQKNQEKETKKEESIPVQKDSEVSIDKSAQIVKEEPKVQPQVIKSTKQTAQFMFVIHDDQPKKEVQSKTEEQKQNITVESQNDEKPQQEENKQKPQPQTPAEEVPRYRRANFVAPQLRPTYPKINENPNRMLFTITQDNHQKQNYNISNEKRSKNLRNHNYQ